MKIDLEGLRGFVAIAELGSFQDAASALNVSPSALTRRVQKLEDDLDTTLLERTTRRVGLTNLGWDFLPKAKRVLDDLDSALHSIRDVEVRRAGHITVSCIPTAANFFLPKVIAAYNAAFPLVRIRILEEGASMVLQRLTNAESDVGITFLGAADSDIEFENILEDPYVLACRHDHPLARQNVVSWQDLKPYRFVAASRSSGNRLLIDRALRSSRWTPNWSYEVQHLPTALGLIEANLAVTALPRMALPDAASSLIVGRPLVDPVVVRSIGVARRRGATLSRAVASFMACLRKSVGRSETAALSATGGPR
jgi:DNA-binding transcriptional LysR family regulator